MSSNLKKKILFKVNHKTFSGFKFEWATLIGRLTIKLKIFHRKLVNSTAGIAPSTYPKPIRTGPTQETNKTPKHLDKHMVEDSSITAQT